MNERPVLPGFAGAQIDVGDCDRVEFCVALHEHERAGHRVESWPAAVKVQIERAMATWAERNGGRRIVLVSSGIAERMCVLIVHHRDKAASAAAPAASAAAVEAAPAAGVREPAGTAAGDAPPSAGCGECGG